MRLACCGLFLLSSFLACPLCAAPPRLLPADIPNSPSRSVLVRPQPASTGPMPTPAPVIAPVPATTPSATPIPVTGLPQRKPKEATGPQLAPRKPATASEVEWQRVKDSESTEPSRVVAASATTEEATLEPKQLEPKQLSTQPLMQSYLRADVAVGSSPRTTGLYDLLARANDSSLRLRVVKTYWEWTFHCAQQRLYEAQRKRLQAIDSVAEGEARWEVARALLKVRQHQNELDLTETRHRLATLSLVATTDLVWPADLPVVGRFRTEYGILFQNRQAPPALEKINLALPKLWQLLSSQAAAVEVLQQSLEETETAYQAGETTLATMLADWERFEQIQQQYLQTAKRYNVEIADYVIAVTGQTSSRERLVSMLIKPKRTTQSVLVPRR